MANPRSHRCPPLLLLCAFQFSMLLQTKVFCYQYRVGNLDAWGIPTSAKPLVYTDWAKNHLFQIGDSLLFLYPPSQDSVIQVTQQNFNSCNLKDPILFMNNGNSLFNITSLGTFYFTSGESGHCEKKQKLQITVGNGTAAYSPSSGPSAADSSYKPAFGTIPNPPASSSSLMAWSFYTAALAGFLAFVALSGSI